MTAQDDRHEDPIPKVEWCETFMGYASDGQTETWCGKMKPCRDHPE